MAGAAGWGGGVGVLHDEHVGGVGAERDSFCLEGLDDAEAQLAEDAVLLVGAHADVDGIEDLAAFDLIDSGNIGVGDDYLFEGGVVADFKGQRFEDGEDLVGVGAGVDAEIEDWRRSSRGRDWRRWQSGCWE